MGKDYKPRFRTHCTVIAKTSDFSASLNILGLFWGIQDGALLLSWMVGAFLYRYRFVQWRDKIIITVLIINRTVVFFLQISRDHRDDTKKTSQQYKNRTKIQSSRIKKLLNLFIWLHPDHISRNILPKIAIWICKLSLLALKYLLDL